MQCAGVGMIPLRSSAEHSSCRALPLDFHIKLLASRRDSESRAGSAEEDACQ